MSVKDPPSTLRPPPIEFGNTIAGSFQAFESSEASLVYNIPKSYVPTGPSLVLPLARPGEDINLVNLAHRQVLGKPIDSNTVPKDNSVNPPSSPKMAKKRRSLQSILIPSFLQSPPTSTNPSSAPPTLLSRPRSSSAPRQPGSSLTKPKPGSTNLRTASPSLYLIDDDPFANISPPPSVTSFAERAKRKHVAQPLQYPLSPAASTATLVPKPATVTLPPLPVLPLPTPSTRPNPVRPKSSGNGQARPAYTKPAFSTRPSLPSLHTLAQMNVVIPKKTRKGTVGARLPHEPWNMDLSVAFCPPNLPLSTSSSSSSSAISIPNSPPHKSSVLSSPPSVAEEIPDLSSTDAEEDETELYGASQDYTDGDLLPSLSYTPSDLLSRSPSVSSTSSWAAAQSSCGTNSSSYSSLAELGEAMGDYDFERYYDHDPLHSEPDFDYYWTSSPDVIYEPEAKPRSRSQSRLREVTRTPYPSFYTNDESLDGSDASFEPGTSASTIRSSLHDVMGNARPESSLLPERGGLDDEVVDGNGWDGGRGDGQRGYRDDWDYRSDDRRGGGNGERGGGGGRKDGNSNGRSYGGGSGGGRDRDGDDGKDRRPAGLSSLSSPSESDSEQEASTDDYGVDSASPSVLSPPSVRSVAPNPDSTSGASTGTDDDVPLAQQIPTALKAQKTIRKQVRDERDQRRRERAVARELESMPRSRQMTYPPPGTGDSTGEPSGIPSSHEVSRPVGRQRTKTMPSNTSRPFAIDDLTKKLLNIQAAGSPSAAMAEFKYPQPGVPQDDFAQRLLNVQAGGSPAAVATALRPRSSQGRDHQKTSANDLFAASRPSLESSRDRGLRSMRSLKIPEARSAAPVDGSSTQRLGRSVTTARSRRADDMHSAKSGSVPPTSYNDGRIGTSDKSTRPYKTSEDSPRPINGGYPSTSSRVSLEYESSTPSLRRDASRPPIPPIPPAEALSNLAQQSSSKPQMTQQRIFVEDKQRYNMVEICSSTNAGEVVEMVESQAALERLGAGSGGWMLWEVAQDFGMERPIRDYELLFDVSASWNKDKLVNIFVVKKTPLAPLLSRSAIPTSSPKNRGYVEWESKRGKWSKRWMELREHGLWLSKRDTGKDEIFLCALSNFDVYYVGKLHKAPKPFVFAIKSTENLSLFENTADYVHYFCCGQKEGETWMQSILLARSYVLYQERNVLFTSKSGAASPAAKSVSRSGTRKHSSVQRPNYTGQPLVSVPVSPPAPKAVFEPGSLLAKRGDV